VTAQDRDLVLALRAERHETRLELSSVERNEDRVLLAAAQDRHARNKQRRGLQFGFHLGGGEHPGLEEIAGIMKFHPHPCGARLFIHVRINVGDATAELAIGQIIQCDRCFLPEF